WRNGPGASRGSVPGVGLGEGEAPVATPRCLIVTPIAPPTSAPAASRPATRVLQVTPAMTLIRPVDASPRMAGVPEDSLRAKVRCMPLPRLRQAVLAASDPAPVAHLIESELGGHEPFHDTGVAHFGLQNAVYAIGDTFVEIVSPIRDDTAVGRHLDRTGGDSGYMAMFEVDDVDATRRR